MPLLLCAWNWSPSFKRGDRTWLHFCAKDIALSSAWNQKQRNQSRSKACHCMAHAEARSWSLSSWYKWYSQPKTDCGCCAPWCLWSLWICGHELYEDVNCIDHILVYAHLYSKIKQYFKQTYWAKLWFPTWLNHESLIGRDHRESRLESQVAPSHVKVANLLAVLPCPIPTWPSKVSGK